ncbi:hypothetical protein A2686_02520 [Candidatus Woesebacteria bacterium RIFCSPHIGHO2_01_FULL_38_10]|uniref:SHS2 domain-containing protein n=1 Tax=Candidatus Woesebacteria bacterium RIFCSPLOWO2_01_FULL_39_10b TaxID=1802517 RepID=A0A1F8B8S6_9BACT|nr:MAG: hypothetical protein A2686_02520 [Candidatus Woesebacteria bacterium RIFCSPHIGHO2_01_FULL_38_10]OGM60442.1 MAG: hypothetical protein A2892_00210 [Candidatus Woesebacteria bacterium RIFCSPLOWO2_01_FULL_39_10b]
MGVGLDIGSKTVKIVELSQGKNEFILKASGIAGHKGRPPEQTQTEKELTPLAETIRKLYKEVRISSKEVSIALPESQVFIRTVKFPLLTDSEIASAIKWEAEQYIPIPISEAIVQHQIIERKEDITSSQTTVLLIAVSKQIVEKYVKVVEMAGLNLIVVETELMSMVRSLAPSDQTVLILDFGAKSTDIAIAKEGRLVFSRSVLTAGEAFTRAIAQGLGIEEIRAEEYKKAYGLSESLLEGKVKEALQPTVRLVSDEIKKAIHFYQSEERGSTPSSLILAGGTAGMPEIASVLTKFLNIEVVIGNPFSKVKCDPQVVKSLSDYASYYSVAVGLAMREE